MRRVLPGASLLAAAPATAQVSGAGLVEVCDDSVGTVPEAGPRGCRSAQSGVWIAAALCRYGGGSEEACSQADGRVLSPEAVQAYEGSF